MSDRPSDRDLVSRGLNGDEAALESLIDRYKLVLADFFARKGMQAAVVDDLVQDTLVEALTSLDRFGHPYHFGGWSLRIASRVYGRWCSKEVSRQRLQDRWSAQALSEGPKEPAEPVDAAVLEALGELSHDVSTLVSDYYLLGMSFDDVASKHGLSRSTVRRRVHEAVDLLRKRCGRTAGGHPSDSGLWDEVRE